MHNIKKRKRFIQSTSVLFAIPLSCYITATVAGNHTWNYLDPALTTTVVDQRTCFMAAPKALLEVSPYTKEGQRLYKIEQVFDNAVQKDLVRKSMEDQIHDNRFVAKKFCDGVTYFSDMDIPVAKSAYIGDANDGLLLIREARHRLVEMLNILQHMNNLAVDAASGTNGSGDLSQLDSEYQRLLLEADNLAKKAYFEQIPLLNGTHYSINVPVQHGRAYERVTLMNASIGDQGLDLSGTSLDSIYGAMTAINHLTMAIRKSTDILEQWPTTNQRLIKAAKEDATTVIVDLRNDQFNITRK